jgi:hypothetical protein
MDWANLVTCDSEGYCAAVDVEAIVRLFRDFVESRNCKMEIDGRRLAHQILRYIQLRSSVAEHQISNPRFLVSTPSGWSAEKEREWKMWIYHIFRLEEWQKEVMDPVFGSNERLWEATCGGWRDELFYFLPWWIKRCEVPMNQDLSEEAKSESEEGSKIDPYLLEHGTAKQRRSAKD